MVAMGVALVSGALGLAQEGDSKVGNARRVGKVPPLSLPRLGMLPLCAWPQLAWCAETAHAAMWTNPLTF
jgi:hypothetical protein